MRIPRDLSGDELAKALAVFGYVATRQTGSHVRLTTSERGEHHVTIPRHRELRIGTARGILADVGRHLGRSIDDVAAELFRG